ncbi:MAG: hypothetical protein IPN80_06565 [Flavobacterium sp.]|nr:hypothetical protein [Flavobacterium sp.]
MKTKILALGFLAILSIVSCTKNEKETSSSSINSSDIVANAKIDNIGDDVAQIVESQSNATEAGRHSDLAAGCLTVSTSQNGSTWTRTLDYGTTNCLLDNGNYVRGKIIITFQDDFDAATRTLNFSFENFYHNDRHVEGNRTVVKTRLENGHIKADIDLNMTITNPDGRVFTRTGHRIREYNPESNEFSVTGSWMTTNQSNGVTHTNTISDASPLRIVYSCQQEQGQNRYELVSGIITITKSNNNNTAVIDYGDGNCDNTGTITINGGSPITFTLRN